MDKTQPREENLINLERDPDMLLWIDEQADRQKKPDVQHSVKDGKRRDEP